MIRKRSSPVQACQILSSGFACEILVEDAMDVMPQAAKAILQFQRKVLVELDPHAAAVCNTGRSSRAEAAA